MKLNRTAAFLMWVVAMLAGPAAGQVEMYLTDETGDLYKVYIAPGGSFTVQLGIGVMEDLVALNCWLSISDNGSGKFWLADRVVAPACPYTDLNTSNRELLEPANALLDPYHERCLGGLVTNFPDSPPFGLYPMAAITIASSPDVPPGTYTLFTIGQSGARLVGEVGDALVEEVEIKGCSYTVVVTADGGGDVVPGDGEPGDGEPGDGEPGDGATADPSGNPPDDSTGGDGPPQGGSGEGDAPNRASVGCGAGIGAGAGLAALLCLGLIRPMLRRW